jgi:hypothetical protein
MLFLQKTTKCGRFTISITSDTPEASTLLLQDSARSLKNLADELSAGATMALRAAVSLLEAHGQPPSTNAVDPSAQHRES